MLILTRKLGESITIGDNIKVSVLGIRGRQVRLGIDAPNDVVVHREEIYVKVQNENRKAEGASKGGDFMGVVKMIKGKLIGDHTDKSSVVDFKKTKPDAEKDKGKNNPGAHP